MIRELESPSGEHGVAELNLVLTDEERVPLYLQIVHQIRYLVTGHDLKQGALMPSVRALAATLGVNTGTVAQAYALLKDEGLLASHQGKGTFVAGQTDTNAGPPIRQARLQRTFDRAIETAFAMGFERSEIRGLFSARLQNRVRTLPIVLIGPSHIAARKYANLVAELLPAETLPTVVAGIIDELQRGEERLLRAYERAYFTVVAFLSNLPTVAAALQEHRIESELIGLTAVLSEATLKRLGGLDPAGNYTLITEARNVNAALALIRKHSPIDLRSILTLTELSSDEQFRNSHSSTVLYTLGVSELLEKHSIPAEARLELAFTLSQESMDTLRGLPGRTQQEIGGTLS